MDTRPKGTTINDQGAQKKLRKKNFGGLLPGKKFGEAITGKN